MHRLTVSLLGLALVGAPLAAQYTEYPPAPYPPDEFKGRHFPFTPGCDDSSFTTAAAADATADAIPDLFLRYGSSVYVCEDPVDHAAIKLVASGVNDFAPLAGAGFDGAHALATVGSNGLQLWSFAPDVTATSSSVQWTSVTIDDSTCANAKLVAVADIDGDSDLDLIVVLSDAATIQVYERSTVGQTAVYTAGASQTTAYAIQDIAIVRWGTAGAPTIAALDSYGLDLYDASLSMVEHLRGNQGGTKLDAFAIVRTASGVDESIAWVDQAAATGNQQELHVVKAGAVTTDTVALHVSTDTSVPAGVVGLAAADRDFDGLTDLAFSVKSSHDILLLMGQTSGTQPFTSAEAGDFEHLQGDFTLPGAVGTGINPLNKAAILWQDLNNDNLPELALGVAADCIVTVLRGTLPDETQPIYGDDPGLKGWYRDGAEYPSTNCQNGTNDPGWEFENQHTLRFELDTEWSGGAFEQLELIVWTQSWPTPNSCPDDPATDPETYLLPDAIKHSFHEFASAGVIDPQTCVDIPIYSAFECQRYYIELRAVNTETGPSGNLRVTSAGPKHIYGFTLHEPDATGTAGDLLAALPGAGPLPNGLPHAQYIPCAIGGGGPINGAPGILLKTPHTPGFGPNITPRPGAVSQPTAFAH